MAQIRFHGLSTAELMRRLLDNVSNLADKEVQLAKTEVRQEVKGAASGVAILAVGAGLLLIAVMSAIVAFILFLAQFIAGWLAGILVALFFAVVGALVAFVGKSRLQIKPLEKTRETLKEDVEWMRHPVKSNGK